MADPDDTDTRGRCWDCKRRSLVQKVLVPLRASDGRWVHDERLVMVCTLHGYNNPYPLRNCPDYRALPPERRQPLPPEERARWEPGKTR